MGTRTARMPCVARELCDDARDSGQHVHVLMAVEVRRAHAVRADAPDLRVELLANVAERDRAAQPALREIGRVRRELPVGADEARHGFGDRSLLREREMHANVERRTACRERRRVLERAAAGHDRSRGHDAILVRLDHGAIHGLGQAEVVRVHDEPGADGRARHLASVPTARGANAQCLQPR